MVVALQQFCCSHSCHLDGLGRYCLPESGTAGVSEPEAIGRFDLGSVTGTWKKLPDKSDSMDEACDMVELPWVFRKALKFLNTLVLLDDRSTMFKTVLKAGGIMDVVEEYPWQEKLSSILGEIREKVFTQARLRLLMGNGHLSWSHGRGHTVEHAGTRLYGAEWSRATANNRNASRIKEY
eukprot:jgi/Picre1/30629/NNA_005990.t1